MEQEELEQRRELRELMDRAKAVGYPHLNFAHYAKRPTALTDRQVASLRAYLNNDKGIAERLAVRRGRPPKYNKGDGDAS